MADEEIGGTGAAGAGSEKQLVFQKIYLKDCSFESPNSPNVFSGDWEPKVNLNMTTTSKDLGADTWEVVLSITIETTVEEHNAFLCEIQQGGIFLVKGFDEDERRRLIGGYCPGIIFPYAREVVSDLVAKGGFPQLLLQPVNFEALYLKHADDVRQAEAEAADASEKH